MRGFRLALLSVMLGLLAGCHSAVINATVSNQTGQAMSLVQVDYPSASFGTQLIAAGASFHYQFKVIGEGAVHLTYTDIAEKEHHAEGPTLHESDDGSLSIVVGSGGAVKWNLQRHGH